jgi:NADH-quinone oxidoreductase subunit L
MQAPCRSRVLVDLGDSIPFGFCSTPSLLMLTVVATISCLAGVFAGYMAGDPGSPGITLSSPFAWAMLTPSISPTMIQRHIFGNLSAGLLLLMVLVRKFSASEAGKKAFVMTRLGDMPFSWACSWC